MYFSMIMPKESRLHEAVRQWSEAGGYAEHQWLWKFFPAPEGAPRDFLFRRRDVQGVPRFYVVSNRQPERHTDTWLVDARDYAPQIEAGDRFAFELRANPVVTISKDGKSARHDVVMQEKKRLLNERGLQRWADWQGEGRPDLAELIHRTCGAWLNKRAVHCGFEIEADCLTVDGYTQHGSRLKKSLQFSTVDFTGRLHVADPVAFRAALFNGIGHAKAFGCGLLLIRRA